VRRTFQSRDRSFVGFESKVMFPVLFRSGAIGSWAIPINPLKWRLRDWPTRERLVTPRRWLSLPISPRRSIQLRGEASLAYERAKEAMELAAEYGFALWVLVWPDRTRLGHGLNWEIRTTESEKMKGSMSDYEATGATLRTPLFFWNAG